MQVSYNANIMPPKRFEIIMANLHFANSEELFSRNHHNHDRARKVKPLILHCNKAYQAARNPSKQQSIDEHMKKFKGHNRMKLYTKSKSIKWGFKEW